LQRPSFGSLGHGARSVGLLLNFRISLDGEVEAGVLRFGPASSEGRFAIVTDVERGMRWTLMARETNALEADGEIVWS
jgi:hypothetical protein